MSTIPPLEPIHRGELVSWYRGYGTNKMHAFLNDPEAPSLRMVALCKAGISPNSTSNKFAPTHCLECERALGFLMYVANKYRNSGVTYGIAKGTWEAKA